MLASILTTVLALSTLALSSPIPVAPAAVVERDTAELYILSNCYSNVTKSSYAAAFWYYPDFLPDYPEPQAVANISSSKAVTFEGKKISISSPFVIKATIPKNATKAEYLAIVAPATTSSFAGNSAVIKGSGEIFYQPEPNVNCYYNYGVRDGRGETQDTNEHY
ncbi:hypothetical protein CJF30_00003843 [Rutstroemia sp. NJR-2017a BBW]|nr:hypothetical protein CJF30_00003843 [Rutstroemia sp. NJR-2017a BBW]